MPCAHPCNEREMPLGARVVVTFERLLLALSLKPCTMASGIRYSPSQARRPVGEGLPDTLRWTRFAGDTLPETCSSNP